MLRIEPQALCARDAEDATWALPGVAHACAGVALLKRGKAPGGPNQSRRWKSNVTFLVQRDRTGGKRHFATATRAACS
jgi:hypothetical protein